MPIYTVRAVATQDGGKFKRNKNGKLPFILSPVNGSRITVGGILDGTIAERLGVVANGVYTIDITTIKATVAGGYDNTRHAVIADLTQAVASNLAAQAVGQMFGAQSVYSTPAPAVTADDTNPL